MMIVIKSLDDRCEYVEEIKSLRFLYICIYNFVIHHKSAKNHVKIHSLFYSAEDALAETRVQTQKMLF